MTAVSAAIVTCVIFISGAIAGVIGLISLAVHREEQNHTLTDPAPNHISCAARRLNGVHVLTPGPGTTTSATCTPQGTAATSDWAVLPRSDAAQTPASEPAAWVRDNVLHRNRTCPQRF